jgi:inhibitor of cysteine peptidase
LLWLFVLTVGISFVGSIALADLCEKCRDAVYTTDIGKCVECKGNTSSSAFKLCDSCSKKRRQCQHCLAALAPDSKADAEKSAGPEGERDKRVVRKKADVALTDADQGKAVKLAVGKIVSITLEANATTGYEWRVEKIEGEGIVPDGKPAYIPKKHAPGVVGVGGVAVFRFKAAKEGKPTIKLVYIRPWEKDVPPVKVFQVQFAVEAKPTATPPANAP